MVVLHSPVTNISVNFCHLSFRKKMKVVPSLLFTHFGTVRDTYTHRCFRVILTSLLKASYLAVWTLKK